MKPLTEDEKMKLRDPKHNIVHLMKEFKQDRPADDARTCFSFVERIRTGSKTGSGVDDMKVRIKRAKRRGKGHVWQGDVGTRSISLDRRTLRIAGPAFEKALRKIRGAVVQTAWFIVC